VIYLNSMSDVARAVSVTATATAAPPPPATAAQSGEAAAVLAGTAAEAHVYLSEELIEE
jgi:hypothetical protein